MPIRWACRAYKTQKCKGIHSIVEVKIIDIDSLYPIDIKKALRGYSGLIVIFVNYHDVEARFSFLTDVRVGIKKCILVSVEQ
mgnify:CR=1 FL=1